MPQDTPFPQIPFDPSAAYRSYSCCCLTKTGDFAGGPAQLSSFASPDQLSHLDNCFDLFSYSFPRWTRHDIVALLLPLITSCSGLSKVCLLSPTAVPSSHRLSLCSRLNFCLLITFLKVFSRVACFQLSFPSCRGMNRRSALLMPSLVCVLLSARQIDQVNSCYNHAPMRLEEILTIWPTLYHLIHVDPGE